MNDSEVEFGFENFRRPSRTPGPADHRKNAALPAAPESHCETRAIARRLTIIALVVAAFFGVLYATGGLHTFAGQW